MQVKTAEFLSLLKKAQCWIYVMFFYLVAGFAFYISVIVRGESNVSSVMNSLVVILPFILPLVVYSKNRHLSILKKFTAASAFYTIHFLLIMFVFAIIFANVGVLKFGLFFNQLLMLFVYGLSLIALFCLLNQVIVKAGIRLLCMNIFSAVIIGVELISSFLVTSGFGHSLLYAISISKYFQGANLGILDIKSLLLFVCITVFCLIIGMMIQKKHTLKIAPARYAISGIIGIYIVFSIISVNGIIGGLDMTPGGFYSLSNNTKEYIQSINQDVSITVLDTEEEFVNKENYSAYFLQVKKILLQMDKQVTAVSVQFTDFDQEDVKAQGAQRGDIVIESNGEQQLLQSEKMFEFSYLSDEDNNTYINITSSQAEQELCSAIDKLVTPSEKNIAFITGFREDENMVAFQSLLQDAGMQAVNVELSEKSELEKYNLLVIYAPESDYDANSTAILAEYMYNDGKYGKNLLYFHNTESTEEHANLEDFLNQWGLYVEQYTIQESDLESSVDNNALLGWNEYLDISFVQDIDYLENPVVIPQASVIGTDTTATDIEYTYLLQSKESSFITEDLRNESMEGPFYTAVISNYRQSNAFANGYTGIQGKVAVISSGKVFEDSIITQTANIDYFVDLTLDLIGENETRIPISAKSLSMKSVEVTQEQSTAVLIVFVFLLPLLMLIVAVIAFVTNRKNR